MAKDGMNLDGILKWSLAHSDGTQPVRSISEQERKWFMEAMQEQTVDVVQRMKEITKVMQTPEEDLVNQGISSKEIEGMLDELQDHIESIDMANDLHTIGGLVPLLGYLKHSNAGIRAKAAEVVTTIVQNNPKSQQLVMEANGIEPLFANFTLDSDVVVRTKALGAISSLIRNNKPGILSFKQANGYAAFQNALGTDHVRFQRKSLSLLQYLLHENSSDCTLVIELGIPIVMINLISSNDMDVREGALRGLLELVQDRASTIHTILHGENEKLKHLLKNRIYELTKISNEDDIMAAKEECQLIETLWKVIFNESSPLVEKDRLSDK
ncbi:Hsp70 nucleotide exchange factor fes1 [Zostera marina]|uniref:Hsp70 nucleotide exchange factor fes1 n=1 Tax=Zostera marina TaxID=29655 RepID=A0A0K9P7R5_ZOSMR|nr:Hsp70 nucleotide exchange factor fes1 [Zostera marina]